MQITGMYWGSKLLKYVDFPTSEVLGPEATNEEVKGLIERHGEVFIKPMFKGGVGKKGKHGLLGRAKDLGTAMQEKSRLYFAEHFHNNTHSKAEGVTFEGGVPAEYEIYFSLTDSTEFRAPMITLTHHGGIDIEELGEDQIARIPFDPLTGLKGFVISNALRKIGAPKELVSPLVQNLPKLWDLFHNYGMTTLELNPIRMKQAKNGRLSPIACDFKCAFDEDDPNMKRLGLPEDLDTSSYSDFELEVNQLRTYQASRMYSSSMSRALSPP